MEAPPGFLKNTSILLNASGKNRRVLKEAEKLGASTIDLAEDEGGLWSVVRERISAAAAAALSSSVAGGAKVSPEERPVSKMVTQIQRLDRWAQTAPGFATCVEEITLVQAEDRLIKHLAFQLENFVRILDAVV